MAAFGPTCQATMDLTEEEKLIRAAQKINSGPNLPFGKLYESYHSKVKSYFLSRTRDEQLAQDLSSQTFAKALSGIDSFRWQGLPFSAWLFRIARNTFFDHLRSVKNKPKIEFEKISFSRADHTNLFDETQQNEEEEWVASLLFTLKPKEREIIYLKFYEGLTNRAIAKIVDLSETNVGTIIYRALKRLREDLKNI